MVAASPIAPRDRSPRHLSGWIIGITAAAAVLSPLLAECLHSWMVVNSGYRFYRADLNYVADASFWTAIAIRAAATFLILLPLTKFPSVMRLVWILSLFFWLWLNRASEAVAKLLNTF